MAANGEELVTLKQVKDNQAFKKIEDAGADFLIPASSTGTGIFIGDYPPDINSNACGILPGAISTLNGKTLYLV